MVFDTLRFFGPKTSLAYSRRGVAKPQLKPTIVPVVFAPFRGIVVQYVRTPRNATRTMAGVRAPVFIGAGVYFRPILVKLAPSRRPQTVSKLRPPAVVTQVVVQVYYGPKTPFVRIRPVPVRSFLRPPVIPPVARPVDVTLAASRRGRAVYRLQPPTVVFLAVEIYGPTVQLAYSVRKRGVADLRPPTVVDVRVYSGPAVSSRTPSRKAPVKALRRRPLSTFHRRSITSRRRSRGSGHVRQRRSCRRQQTSLMNGTRGASGSRSSGSGRRRRSRFSTRPSSFISQSRSTGRPSSLPTRFASAGSRFSGHRRLLTAGSISDRLST